jgi:hypothetical protein
VRSNHQVDLAKVNTDDALRWVGWFWDWNRDNDVQVEFPVPMTLENSESGFRSSEDWDVALSDFESALDSFPVASRDAHPDFIIFQKQSEKSCVQVQRLRFESQRFYGLLFGFDSFVRFCNTANRTNGIVSREVEPLSDVSVSSVVESNGMEAPLGECYLTDSVACISEDTQRPFQTLFIFY